MFWLFYFLLWLPIKILAPRKVVGYKNFDKKKTYITICNHQSNFDPIIETYVLKKHIYFVAKKELWKNKEKSFFYDTILDCIKVDRSKGLTLSATKEIFSKLDDKKTIGIFPEGTRRETNDNMEIKNGACLFAIKSKTPILPCFILKKQKPFRRNVFIIGKPFELTEFYDKKIDKNLLDTAGNILIEKMLELKTNYEALQEQKKIGKKPKNNKL